ncbi:EF-hand domain-containing protein [Streptomyces sp. I05A-00742]|uniref:EF-hand domain-containing protein n=1 Tax=Streptomyces sp. I05A-00742 TaxID=2732853 RepID=UPI0014886C97|nr:EF-hand domain-containing protein [Streptomyces sp. I05A-00742]
MSDVLRQKYEHRFRQLDVDDDGFISQDDVRGRARQLADAFGVPAHDPLTRNAEDAADVYWKGIVSHTPDGGVRRVDCPAFVAALDAAREDGTLRSMVKPAVRAHLAVTDQDGDGTVDADEFTAAQQAVGIPQDQALAAFSLLDVDGDGRLTLAEWENAVWEFYTSTDPEAPGNRVLGHG